MSPTQRTLAECRKHDWVVGIAEHWSQWSQTRHDLLGFIDLVVLRPGIPGVLGIQTTSGANAAARRTKISGSREADAWLSCLNEIEVWAWSKTAAGPWKCHRWAAKLGKVGDIWWDDRGIIQK